MTMREDSFSGFLLKHLVQFLKPRHHQDPADSVRILPRRLHRNPFGILFGGRGCLRETQTEREKERERERMEAKCTDVTVVG